MSRRRPSREQLAPSMFPFLAVLLCTMGALVLMLILMVSQARASARRKVQEKADELQDTIDQVTVSGDEFENEFRRNADEMQMQQERLARVEDHIRRITEELNSLQEKFSALEDAENEIAESQAEQIELDSEIDALKKQIAEKTTELKEQLAEQKKQQKAFAIVPYSGTNGTARRPIYLECRNDGVVIQPEGILLTFDDLKPPFNTGNPLDASLRLIRSELLQAQLTNSVYSNAYPLLLVRPDGIRAYTLARAAMKNWDDQFGYELISKEMPLVFPKSLPGLTPKLQQAILEARQRQTALVQSLPPSMRRAIAGATFDTEPLQQRDPINRNGLTLEEFGEELGSSWRTIDTLGDTPASQSGTPVLLGGEDSTGGSQYLPGQFNLSDAPSLASGDWQFSEIPSGNSSPAVASGIETPFGNRGEFGQKSSNAAFDLSNNNVAGLGSINASLSRNGSGKSGGSSFDNLQFGTEQDTNTPVEYGNLQPAGEGVASSADTINEVASSTGSGDQPRYDGITQSGGDSPSFTNNPGPANGTGSNGSTGSSSNTGNSSQSAGQNGASSNGTSGAAGETSQSNQANEPPSLSFGYQNRPPTESGQSSESAGSASSFGESSGSGTRGDGVGGQQSGVSQQPGGSQRFGAARASGRNTVVRHISMYITNDRWYVLSENNPQEVEKIIELQQGPSASRMALVSTLQSRVDSWGQASQGGYWKPVLYAQPAPGADVGIQRLRSLLKGSNVELLVPNQSEETTATP